MLGNLFRTVLGTRRKADAAQRAISANARAYQAMARADHAAALALFREAFAADSTNLEALANQGLCHAMLLQYAEAEQCLGAVLRHDPKGPLAAPAHMNLGNIALARHYFTDACAYYEAALALAGPNPDLLNNLGLALHRRGLPDEGLQRYREALQLRADYQDASSNLLFAMQHSPEVPAEELFKAFRDWAARFESPLASSPAPHSNSPDPGRRLRVGYVSGDFFKHAVSNFIEPVLRHHDRTAFEVVCYATRAHADEQTAVLRSLADQWREAATLSDEALAERVRADAVDILVDLSSHTVGHRLLAFARRPAPVQITWLGYPTTTGLDSMDYRISDAVSDPPAVAQAFHSERLLYLPRTQWCYRPDPIAPPVRDLPALSRGQVTFGSFNNPSKLNEGVLRLWARVLMALPDTRINVACVPDHRNRLRIADALITHGAAPSQVTITGTLEQAEFWRIRDDIDIVLDAHPYNGTTTTCEALWAGLPVITLAGRYGAARSATSILTSVGLSDLVAEDESAYIEIARRLAADLPQLAVLRRGMRQRLIDAGFCDGARFTRELEALYRAAWTEWCENRT